MGREARVLRYKEKRKNRKFDKTIRCAAPMRARAPTQRRPLLVTFVLAALRCLRAISSLSSSALPHPRALSPVLPARPRSYASRKAYAEARPRVKGRFAKRGTLPGDEGYVPPGEEDSGGGGGGGGEEELSDFAFVGLLTEGMGGGMGMAPLQPPLQWLEAQGH
jgi:hypothetical protein